METSILPNVPAGTRLGAVTIDSRLNGPRRAANGGFAAGTIASHVDAETVRVVLRRPVPLGSELDVHPDGQGGILVHRGRALIAEARPGTLSDHEPPATPSLAEATEARRAYPFYGARHAFADCIVCGPGRRDGMHVTPGPVPGRPGLLATPWTVRADLAVGGRAIHPSVWAALDCPSYPAAAMHAGIMCLLGTITARVERRPRIGETLVVYSWTRGVHGRRYETSSALVDEHGDLVARADAVWIAARHQRLVRFLGRFV